MPLPHFLIHPCTPCRPCKQPLRAVESLKQMRAQNLKPSVKVRWAWAWGHAVALRYVALPLLPAVLSLPAYSMSANENGSQTSMLRYSPGHVLQVYGALAKGFARSGDWRRAIEVINLMQCDGLEPNEQASCSRAGWGGLWQLLSVPDA